MGRGGQQCLFLTAAFEQGGELKPQNILSGQTRNPLNTFKVKMQYHAFG